MSADEIENLLKSGSAKRLGMGSRRACYAIPDTNLCVKCYRSEEEIAEGRHPGSIPARPLVAAVAREIRRFRFDEKRNTSCQEFAYWKKLKERLAPDDMAFLPSTMETLLVPSRGWCVVEELISNADNSPVRKFHEEWALADEEMRSRLIEALDAFAELIERHAIHIYDPQNILVQKLADGSVRLRVTDFEPASRTLMPLDRLSSAIARMKIRRRMARYRRSFGIYEGLKTPSAADLRALPPVNVLCVKWGDYYGPEYVNRLYAGVKRNLHRPFRFVCVTDDARGLVDGVDAMPMPEAPPDWNRHWPHIFIKLLVFKDGFADLKGPTLFLDIDQVILGDMGAFFDYLPGRFCIIHNWIEWRKRLFRRRPDIGNSSCFRFEAGGMNYVYEKFLREKTDALDTSKFRTEQAFMTYAVGVKSVNWWPESWVVSFKRSCSWPFPLNLLLAPKRPANARILCFHGHPDPEEAICGYRGKKHVNERTLPAEWIRDSWYLPNET